MDEDPSAMANSARGGGSTFGSASAPTFTLVRLRAGLVCLCRQRALLVTDPSTGAARPVIDVALHLLPDMARVSFRIPFPASVGQEVALATRAFCGSVCDSIIVYIPGVFLKYVDCSFEHEPCEGLTLGPEHVPPLHGARADSARARAESSLSAGSSRSGGSGEGGPTAIPDSVDVDAEVCALEYPFRDAHGFFCGSVLRGENLRVADSDGYGLVDRSRGVAYTYRVDTEAFLGLFMRGSLAGVRGRSLGPATEGLSDFLVRTIHLLSCHLHAHGFSKACLEAVYLRAPWLVTPAVMREYLLASTFAAARAAGSFEPLVLAALPVSTLRPFTAAFDYQVRREGLMHPLAGAPDAGVDDGAYASTGVFAPGALRGLGGVDETSLMVAAISQPRCAPIRGSTSGSWSSSEVAGPVIMWVLGRLEDCFFFCVCLFVCL
jgi:hypothetical protein